MEKEGKTCMREWSNEPRLSSLSGVASIDHDGKKTLTFMTSSERADVLLTKGGLIQKVSFFDARNGHSEIFPDVARHLSVGEGNCERRVTHFLMPGGPAPTMRLGITRHDGMGTWSSLPHDFENNPETGFEEIFFYTLEGGTKRAIQVGKGLWCDGSKVDSFWPVYDQTFGMVPMGYHPIVGEPGVRVSYVWVYLAKHPHWEKVK